MRGRIDAEIVQSCVVTLEPLTNSIAEEVDTIFVPKNSRLARIQLDDSGEMLLDAEGADSPEVLSATRSMSVRLRRNSSISPSILSPQARLAGR